MATWLVTGGCGFIGSHLADALIARGDKVRILDDLSTGKRENAPPSAEIVVGDVQVSFAGGPLSCVIVTVLETPPEARKPPTCTR